MAEGKRSQPDPEGEFVDQTNPEDLYKVGRGFLPGTNIELGAPVEPYRGKQPLWKLYKIVAYLGLLAVYLALFIGSLVSFIFTGNGETLYIFIVTSGILLVIIFAVRDIKKRIPKKSQDDRRDDPDKNI